MRPNNSNKRQRSRNRNKNSNPLARSYESNGPDVKIRGSALQVADKYAQLARDAQSSGDRVMAENYFQHAEHYYRIVAQAYEQNGQSPRDRRDEREEFGRDDPQPDVSPRDMDERETATATPRTVNGNGHDAANEDEGLRRTLRANGASDEAPSPTVLDVDDSADVEPALEAEVSEPAPKPAKANGTSADANGAAEAAAETTDAAEPTEAAEPAPEDVKPKRRTRTTRTRRTRRTETTEASASKGAASEPSEQAS